MNAATVDRERALAIFADGRPRSARDIAVACNIHTQTAAWFLVQAEKRGWLRRLPIIERHRAPEFGLFVRPS